MHLIINRAGWRLLGAAHSSLYQPTPCAAAALAPGIAWLWRCMAATLQGTAASVFVSVSLLLPC